MSDFFYPLNWKDSGSYEQGQAADIEDIQRFKKRPFINEKQRRGRMVC